MRREAGFAIQLLELSRHMVNVTAAMPNSIHIRANTPMVLRGL